MGRRLAPLRALRLTRLTAELGRTSFTCTGRGPRSSMRSEPRSVVEQRARERETGRSSSTRRTVWPTARRRAGFERQVSLGAERLACCGTEAVISVSQADLTDLERRGFLGGRCGFHVANAVRTPAADRGDRIAARQRLGLATDALVVGTVSRLVPQKAVGDLVDAVARIAPGFRGSSGPPAVVVVGDGPLRASLDRRVRAGTNGARVMLLGARGNVPKLLPAFDVFVLSSHWEGEPIALLEAMAAGLPCVATATEGAREILGEDASSGRLVPIGDVGRLGDALADLLRDAREREVLGEAARARVRSRTPDAQAVRVAGVYRQLLRAKRS